MPKNNTDVCWAVKTPILYGLHSYGQIKVSTNSTKDYERVRTVLDAQHPCQMQMQALSSACCRR